MSKSRVANHETQRGGITILTVLMLLVLLTIAAMGMSQNGLREVMISATARQGAQVRNGADSGLDWAIYWFQHPNALTAQPALTNKRQDIERQGKEIGGEDFLLPAAGSMQRIDADGATSKFDIQLTYMGFCPLDMTGQNVDLEKISPGLWAVRSLATLDYGNGIIFNHARESMLMLPKSNVAETE